METIGQRIKSFRKALNLTQKQVAVKLGISTAAVTQWETDITKPSGENLLTLARTLNKTPESILALVNAAPHLSTNGSGSDLRYSLTRNEISDNIQPYVIEGRASEVTPIHGLYKIPLISAVQAGAWNEAMDYFNIGDAAEWRETTSKVSQYAFALRVEGDSMTNPYGLPSIPEGSIVIVDPEIVATSGKIVIAKLTDSNQVTIKKLVIDGPHTYLKPLNPEHSLIKVNDNCMIVGVVTQVVQDL